MKLRSVTIFHNHYEFVNDGVQPDGYGGTISMYMPTGGTVDVKLDNSQITAMIETIAVQVSKSIASSLKQATPADIIRGSMSRALPAPGEGLNG